MNGTLTGLGIALVVALVTALIGPFFIDWNDHRAAFEAQAGRLLGVPVKVLGEVEARILPSPRIRFEKIVAGDEWAASRFTADSFELDVALMPMLGGEFQVTSLRVDGADLKASLAADGEVLLPVGSGGMSRADLDAITITDLEVRNSRITIADPAANQSVVIENAGLQGQASSLAGPMKFDARGTIAGRTYTLHATTGRFDTSGAGRVKLSISSAGAPEVTLDGGIRLAKKPHFEGTGSIVQTAAPEGEPAREPWRIAGQVWADVRTLEATKVEFDYGPPGRELRLSGGLGIVFGPKPSAEVRLSGRQIDLDRALGRAKDAPPLSPAEVLAGLAGRFPDLTRPALPLRITADVGNVSLGGDFVQNLEGAIVSTPGGWTVEALSAGLPGGARVDALGALMVREGEGPRFSGPVRLEAPNVPALVHWLEGLGGKRPSVALKSLKLEAALAARPGAYALEDLVATADGADIRGRLAFTDVKDARNELEARLNAETLDLDALQLARLSRIVGASEGTDVDLTLRAAKLKYAGVTWSGVDVDLSATQDAVDIRRLTIADLGGARIVATGRLAEAGDQPTGRLEARIDARTLDGLVTVLRTSSLPPAVIDALGARADVVAPLSVGAVIASSGGGTGGVTAEVSGTLGGTSFEFDASAPGLSLAGPVKARLRASAGDAARLLGQLGLPAVPLDDSPTARLEAKLDGDPADGASVEIELATADDRVAFKGKTREGAGLVGRIDTTLDNAGRYLVLLGRAPPASLPTLPVVAGSDVSWGPESVKFSRLAGLVAGREITGGLSYEAEAGLRGNLEVDSLGLSELAGIALGPLALGDQGASGWPKGPLSPGLLEGLEGRIAVRAERLEIAPGRVAGETAFDLAFGRNEFAVHDVRTTFADGKASGNFAVRRAGDDISLAARLSVEDAELAEFVWSSAGGAAATGRIDLTADVLGTGKDIASVVETLTGSGSFTVHDAKLGGIDAGAFERTLIAVEAGTEPASADDIARRFTQELAMADLEVTEISSAFTIASGVVRISNAAITAPLVSASASGTLNLKTASIDAQMTMRPKVLAELTESTAPHVDLILAGPWHAPVRSTETTAFANVLAVRAVEREIERVEKMEAERRERERRAAEEQARLKREAEKRAAEEAEAARLKAIREATGEVPLGALPPPIAPRKPAPPTGATSTGSTSGSSSDSRRQSPLDFLRRPAVPEASR